MNIEQSGIIAENGNFQRRVRYLMIKKALAVLGSGTPTEADKILGQAILDLKEPVLPWAIACVTNATIAAGAHSESGSTIVDSDLEFTVNSFWDAFAV